jgi:transposase-like protein
MSTFSTQESCIAYLECKRWGDKPICPYCGSDYTNPLPKQLAHHCNGCRKSFRVTVGTIFHDTKIPLQKWFLLISLIMNAKKGLSACQASRDLGIRRPTVWSMMHRVRGAMKDNHDLFSGIVEQVEIWKSKLEEYKQKAQEFYKAYESAKIDYDLINDSIKKLEKKLESNNSINEIHDTNSISSNLSQKDNIVLEGTIEQLLS